MVLRKPYALLIKHFKFIHVIFTLISLFLLFRCNDLLDFINEYIVNNGFILEDYRIKELLPSYLTLLIIFGVFLNIVVAFLLKNKDKKILFYIVNIIIYIIVFVGFAYTSTILNSMQLQIIDTRVVRALRDIFNAVRVAQLISLFMYAFRATGFDIKSFNFTKDLIDLQIEEKDNEEVEVSVDIDVNKFDRNRRKSIRMLKYFYLEHRFWCNVAFGIISIFIVSFAIYSFTDRNISYQQFQVVNVDNTVLQIEDVYITDKDRDNNIIDKEKSFVIVEVKAKKNTTKEQKLNVGRLILKVDGVNYYHNNIYKSYFEDFGNIYTNQDLSSDYQRYFLIYPIGNEFINSKMYINYVNNIGDVVVNFDAIHMKDNKVSTFKVNDVIDFENTVIDGYKFTLNKFELAEKIKVNYKYFINSKDSISAVEYIVPTISTNYDKAILRLDGTISIPDEYNSYVVNMDMLLFRFGQIKYTIGNKTYTGNFLGTVKANKVKQDNTVYYEVKREVLDADKVVLVLKIRNQTYEIVLKDGEE